MNEHALPPSDIAADLTQLRADFGRLSESVSQLVVTQGKIAADSIRGSIAQAGESAAGVGASAYQMTSDAQNTAISASHDLERAIARNPLTAMVIAASAGIVLGMMTARN